MSNLKGKPLVDIQRAEAIQDARNAVIEAAKGWRLYGHPSAGPFFDTLTDAVAKLAALEAAAKGRRQCLRT